MLESPLHSSSSPARPIGAYLQITLLMLVLLCSRFARGEAPVVLKPGQKQIPASYFSLNILFHPLTRVPWPAVPFGGWRLSHVNWADLEPQKGEWHFDLLDRYAAWGEEHHTEIMMSLTYTPRWASSNPNAHTDVAANNPPGLSGAPKDMEDWRNFVRTVATRYRGKIHIYEIWNEPNRPQSWTGSVETLITMTREARIILKEVDPTNIVLSPPPEQEKGLPWLKAFLEKGGAQYVDGIGYHFYVGKRPPEAMVSLIQQVRALMAQYHTGERPLWNTEAGWLGEESPYSEELQVAYLARAYVLNWAAGVSRFFWYAWDDHHGTLVELIAKDNSTLTAAGKAFSTVQRWLLGAVLESCTTAGDGTWVCALSKDGRTSHIVWYANGNKGFTIPEQWHAIAITDLTNSRKGLPGTIVTIGALPVFIQ